MRDRIRTAGSVEELEQLISESESERYRKARPSTERTWRKAAQTRREELR